MKNRQPVDGTCLSWKHHTFVVIKVGLELELGQKATHRQTDGAIVWPGESYELHQGTDTQPSIIVHVCEDPVNYEKRPKKIVQTRCPARKPDNKPS